MASKMSRLLALSDSEYSKNRVAPVRQRFKGMKVNMTVLDRDWERQRGGAARLAGVILQEDSESLLQKISADADTAAGFSDALSWLRKEATILRKTAVRLDLAVSRLSAVLNRHRALPPEPGSAAPAQSANPVPPIN